MKKIIEGINILEKTPVKDYTILSYMLMVLGFSIAIIAVIIFFNKTKHIGRINFKSKLFKVFLFFYVFGLGLGLFSVIRFPWFYVETGKYIYKCEIDDNVPVNYIGNNFDVISVEGNIWTIKDR